MALAACCTAALPITDPIALSLHFSLSESTLPRRWSLRTCARSPADRAERTNTSASHSGSNAGAELQSRRRVVQTGGALGFLAVVGRLPALAQEDGEIGSVSESGSSTATEREPKKALVDTESWYRYRGEGFRMTIPPDYIDLVEYDDSGTSLYGERAKEKPFAARFASPDRKAVLSVVVRNGSQLKLSFLQTQDITEFGSLEEAAKVFVPAGSKIVSAAALKPTDSRVLRTYYLYEFVAKDDKRVVISAAAAGGRVFVFGAVAPNSRWKDVGSTMRSAAVNFALI